MAMAALPQQANQEPAHRFYRMHFFRSLEKPEFLFPQRLGIRFQFIRYKRNDSMEANYDIFEIVAVIRDFWLIDAESYQRRYCTDHGQPLAPGYYIANWPEYIRERRFHDRCEFYGPFELRREAQAALEGMHEEWQDFLARSAEAASAAHLKAARPEVKKVCSQKLQQVRPQKLSKSFAA
jgi:hypothetical protein